MKKKDLAKYWGFSHGKKCIGKNSMKSHDPAKGDVYKAEYMLRNKPYTGDELTNEDLVLVSLYANHYMKISA